MTLFALLCLSALPVAWILGWRARGAENEKQALQRYQQRVALRMQRARHDRDALQGSPVIRQAVIRDAHRNPNDTSDLED